MRQFAIPAGTVALVIWAVIAASYLLPSAQAFGAQPPQGMVAPLLLWTGLFTGIAALCVGVLWSTVGQRRAGMAINVAVAVLLIGFILWVAWVNGLIPHEYAWSIP